MIIYSHGKASGLGQTPKGGEVMSEVIALMVIVFLIIVTIKEK